MTKNLTTSRLDRQNVLNNEFAIEEIKESVDLKTVPWNGKSYVTKEMIAAYFQVDIRTIERYLAAHSEELSSNGYEVLKGERLDSFCVAYAETFATDINVAHKIRSLGVFDFRASLNMAMLLAESEPARALRQLTSDVVIDLINCRTGGGVKFINKQDKNFVFSSLQEEDYWFVYVNQIKQCIQKTRSVRTPPKGGREKPLVTYERKPKRL